jgi:hypothetical protein
MKLMFKFIKKRYALFMSIAAIVSLSRCATITEPESISVPMTPMLIQEVGVENMVKFQYYLSKDITLQSQRFSQNDIIFRRGVAIRVNKDVKDVIEFDKEVSGVATISTLTQAMFVNYQALAIEFEEDPGKKLYFAAPLADPESRFEILFHDNNVEGIIIYGENEYRAFYKGADKPFLMVKVGRNVISEDLYRKVVGRAIEE